MRRMPLSPVLASLCLHFTRESGVEVNLEERFPHRNVLISRLIFLELSTAR